jgi:hypothetical protein
MPSSRGVDIIAARHYVWGMKTVRLVFWRDGEYWIGHLDEYPDYQTQGTSLEELKANILDIYADISAGLVPEARKAQVLELTV